MTYADLKDLKPTAFKRFCGVKPHTFATRLKALQQREQQKKKPERTADLALEDQLLLSLQDWRESRTYFHLSVSGGVSAATVCRIINRVEDLLIQAQCLHLPGKKKLRQANASSEVLVVDASERPLERPKKTATQRQREEKAAHAQSPVRRRPPHTRDHLYGLWTRVRTRFPALQAQSGALARDDQMFRRSRLSRLAKAARAQPDAAQKAAPPGVAESRAAGPSRVGESAHCRRTRDRQVEGLSHFAGTLSQSWAMLRTAREPHCRSV